MPRRIFPSLRRRIRIEIMERRPGRFELTELFTGSDVVFAVHLDPYVELLSLISS